MMGLLEAAIRYRRRGWSVIPIDPAKEIKKPLVKWQELQERLPTEEEITQWWTQWPGANIGVITGRISGLVVVDEDPDKGGNADDILLNAPTGRISLSGSGGRHLYYRIPSDAPPIPNRVDVQPGIDIRGEGGYVVVPPSVHANGRRYRWIEKGKPGTSIPPFALEPAHGSVGGNGNGNGKRVSSEPWLTEALQGIKHGARDDTAARLAGYYINKNMPEDVVIETLVAWDLRNDPPLGRKIIEEKVHSVMKTHNRKLSQVRKPSVRLADQDPSEPFALQSLHDYMVEFGDQPVTWAIKDWLPEKTIAMAVAPPGTYKTWMELALAVSIASGRPFLGKYEILAPGPVIVIQQEDYHGQMAERIACVMGALFDFSAREVGDNIVYSSPPRLPIFLHPDRKFRFDNSVVVEALEEKIDRIRPALVIVDPLYSTGRVDDFGVDLVENMWPVKTLRDRYGCSFFISHHTGKGKTETEREDLWGVQFLNAFMETGWQIRRKDQKNTARVRRHFKVRQDAEEEVLKFDISTEPPYKFEVDIRQTGTEEDKGPDIVDVVQHFGPMSQAELVERTGMDKSTISRRVKNLITAQLLFKDAGGKISAGELNIEPSE